MAVLARFDDDTAVTEKVVNEGESVMLQCSPPKSVPAPVISWGSWKKMPMEMFQRVQSSLLYQ